MDRFIQIRADHGDFRTVPLLIRCGYITTVRIRGPITTGAPEGVHKIEYATNNPEEIYTEEFQSVTDLRRRFVAVRRILTGLDEEETEEV